MTVLPSSMTHHIIPPLLLIFSVFVCSQIHLDDSERLRAVGFVVHRYHHIFYPHTDAVYLLGLINTMYGETTALYYCHLYYYLFKLLQRQPIQASTGKSKINLNLLFVSFSSFSSSLQPHLPRCVYMKGK